MSFILTKNRQKNLFKDRPYTKAIREVAFQEISSLPKLAWSCKMSNEVASFEFGPQVEHFDEGILEGIWDGEYKEKDFHKTDFVFGSGARLVDNEIVFVPPKHCAESLFYLHDKENQETYIANSLCHVLERSNCTDQFTENILAGLDRTREDGLSFGIDMYDSMIAEDDRHILRRFVFYNFSIGENGSIRLHWSKPAKYFKGFNEYRAFMSSKINELLKNAQCADRNFHFPPIATLSKGYDSPAACVLAKENGCKDAITIDVSVWDLDDCGLDIGKALELNVEVVNHVLGDDIKDLNLSTPDDIKNISYEFIATAGIGDDITFFPMRNSLSGRTLLSGVYGDFIWDVNAPAPSGLPKRGIFGKSTTEFRLNNGYVHIPTACLGARFAPPINRISSSKTMKSFRVGGDYDRPIPRRIVEDAGIERNEFGIKKCATAPNLLDHHSLFLESVKEIRKRYRK